MEQTSDERREVAARLREAAKTKSNSADYLWKRLEIAVNGWRFGDAINDSYTFDNDVLARLADLIDLTCEMKIIPKSSHCMCSRCGAFVRIDAVTSCTEVIPVRHCPNCGARVVDDGQ